MAVARAATLAPLEDIRLEVDQRAIVLGAGLTGMTAALSLAEQGFETALVEREPEPGGIARRHPPQHRLAERRPDPQAHLAALIDRVAEHPPDSPLHRRERRGLLRPRRQVQDDVAPGRPARGAGRRGRDRRHRRNARTSRPSTTTRKATRSSPNWNWRRSCEDPAFAAGLREVVMIQCVGSRDEEHPYCSRVCCQEAVKNALAIKQANPAARVYVLFRDMRTYGMSELALPPGPRGGRGLHPLRPGDASQK